LFFNVRLPSLAYFLLKFEHLGAARIDNNLSKVKQELWSSSGIPEDCQALRHLGRSLLF
jgi:hypothetical protein